MFETLAKLKQFSLDIQNVNTIEEIELTILQIKAYIQNSDILKNICNNKITEFKNLKSSLKYKLLCRYLCGELDTSKITARILYIDRNMYINWWDNINTENPNGLNDLYLIPEPNTEHFNKYKNKKIITKNMCYPLYTFFNNFLVKHNSCLNIYMFYQEVNTIYKTINPKFYLLYLKAVSNGTLSFLTKAITSNTHENYNLKTTKIKKPKLTYNTDNQTFYINGKEFQLEPVECTCLAVYCGFTEHTLQADEKSARNGINSKWKKLNFSNENLIKKPRGKQVKVNKNIIDIDY